jgi:hypothetical protein
MRIDNDGRDVTDLPGLWCETDCEHRTVSWHEEKNMGNETGQSSAPSESRCYTADATVDMQGKRLRWQCGCRQNGGTQVIQRRKDDPDFDAIIAAATEVLRASHIGDQNFISCLKGDDAARLRLALVALGDVFRQG